MLLTVLRHGQVQGRAHVFRGQSNPPLTPLGLQQLQQSLHQVQPKPTLVLSSPLQRCASFAQQQAQALQVPLQLWDELREIDFGRWEGLTPGEAAQQYPLAFAQFQHDTLHWCPPQGEPYEAFAQRVQSALLRCRSLGTEHVLMLTHGGVVRALLAQLLQISPASAARFSVPLAGLCQCWLGDDGDYLLQLQAPCIEADASR